ncbi:N-acetylneuraminate synthase family protein, partial [Nitrosopumilus sp.]|nr:N-acetylneuraminate synthase family protein [Nitrosopumilus sp.]
MLFSKNKTFIIAEMANSHEGVLNTAKKIVKSAAEAGADAVKFQKFFADELAQPDHEYYNLYKKLEMKNNEWKELILYAKSKKLKVFVDIFGIKSAKQFVKFPIDGFKIHSADVGNLPLLK